MKNLRGPSRVNRDSSTRRASCLGVEFDVGRSFRFERVRRPRCCTGAKAFFPGTARAMVGAWVHIGLIIFNQLV